MVISVLRMEGERGRGGRQGWKESRLFITEGQHTRIQL